MRYFSSPLVSDILLFFRDNLSLEPSSLSKLRKASLFRLFEHPIFIDLYIELAKEIACILFDSPEDTCVQSSPTPRILHPGSHGTSLHADYWYGHGISSYTVWVPIVNCIPGSTFFLDPIHSNLNNNPLHSSALQESLRQLSTNVYTDSNQVLPPPSSVCIFSSAQLHGSPLNTSNSTRVSFDFRLSRLNDPTSTKDLANYLHYSSSLNAYTKTLHPLEGRFVLRYVVGGSNRNTYAQHILIDAYCSRYDLNASDQEAEIERYGYPFLSAYLDQQYSLERHHDAILLASSSILSEDVLAQIKNQSTIEVWAALENQRLSA